MNRSRAHFTSVLRRKLAPRQVSPQDSDESEGLTADALLNVEQMFVNEALVHKVFECERKEVALRAAEKKLNRLLAHQFNTRENERKRFARELQDSLDQHLLALRLELAKLAAHTTASDASLQQCTETALTRLDSTIISVRQIIANMRPFQLELGLAAAVEWELAQFQRVVGLPCDLTLDPQMSGLVLPDETVAVLYRALQECLNNIQRHAMAQRVTVVVGIVNDAVCMNVSDDGTGFDVDTPMPPQAYGILGMKQGIRAIGGYVIVGSSRSEGTRVTLSVPVTPTRAGAA